MIVRVNIYSPESIGLLLTVTDVFGKFCSSRLQSQSELYHVGRLYLTLVIDLIGQL